MWRFSPPPSPTGASPRCAAEKIKKAGKGSRPQLTLVENPDILKTIAQRPEHRPALVIGFAAETDGRSRAREGKRASKGCDWIVANDVSPETGVFGGDSNTVHLITAGGTESWPEMTKEAVADTLMSRIAEFFASGGHSDRAAE